MLDSHAIQFAIVDV